MSALSTQLARTEPARSAVDETPATALDRLGEAQRRHATGALAMAKRLYRETIDLDPRLAEAVHALGRIAGQQRRREDARALAERAAAHDRPTWITLSDDADWRWGVGAPIARAIPMFGCSASAPTPIGTT